MTENGGTSEGRILDYLALIFACFVGAAVILSLLRILPDILLEGDEMPLQRNITFASAASTVLLVGVTFWYAYQTRRMAENTERRRKEEQNRQERERLRELNSLRQALIKEIQTVNFIENEEDTPLSRFQILDLQRLVPTEVYEGNTDKIGLLTEAEVKEVVEYYSLAYHLEDLLKAHRDMKQDSRWGLFSTNENSEFVSAVSERHQMLKQAQENATNVLRENLDSKNSVEELESSSKEEKEGGEEVASAG